MALVSSRFSGVPELEQAAVDDSAHLLIGSSGPAVALVQQALSDLGEDIGAAGADGVYGSDTEAAVVSYKTTRNILNAQGQIDGIVGKKTIASLDDEIATFDAQLGGCPPDEPGPSVALAGAPEPAVNAVLGELGVGSLLDIDAEGQSRLMLADAVPAESLKEIVDAAPSLFGPNNAQAVASLTGALPQLALVPAVARFVDIGILIGDAVQQLAQLAANLPGVPSGVGTSGPARDLSKQQALLEAAQAHQQGEIVMTPAPTFDASGAVTAPPPTTTVSVAGAVAGVTFNVVNFADKRSPKGMAYAPVAAPLLALDVRNLVGLTRLARHLAATFGVTEIHHAGISGANDPNGDCHRQGRACDFVGAAGTFNGTAFLFTVFNDWALKSVPNLDDPTKPRRPDWPTRTMQLEYRLKSDPNADPSARDFFQDLYDFVASEYQDRSAGPGQTQGPTTIGEPSFVMTPDHPTSKPGTKNGREAHRSHIHFQIGPTGTQVP
jgi:peptidoglycan hydrolase-like protein with peptidoglycan-binding domain